MLYSEQNIGYQGPVVVFDLDDTLYEERDYAVSAYHAVGRYIADTIPTVGLSEADITATMTSALDNRQNPFNALFDKVPELGSRIDDLLSIYRLHDPQINLPTSSRHLLDSLTDNGVLCGLITDGRSATQRNKIHALGIERYFSPHNILISEETGADKTDMKPFVHFVHRYVNARAFFYIGDNPEKDFKIPNLLGWTTICLKDKGHNIHPQLNTDKNSTPAYMVDDIIQAKEIIIR